MAPRTGTDTMQAEARAFRVRRITVVILAIIARIEFMLFKLMKWL